MKNNFKPVLLSFILFISIASTSCFTIECHESDCPKDVKIPDNIEELAPYKANDLVTFVSSAFDTISFVCTNREIFEETGYPDIEGPDDCCKLYKIEGFECKFKDDLMYFHNSNYGGTYLFFKLIVENDTVSSNFISSNIINIGDRTIAGQQFFNVEVSKRDTNIYLVREPALGLVGFNANGKEWRKLF